MTFRSSGFIDTHSKMIYYDLVLSGCGSVGRALRSGRRSRVFESRHSEQGFTAMWVLFLCLILTFYANNKKTDKNTHFFHE